jgi:hypothetical protein
MLHICSDEHIVLSSISDHLKRRKEMQYLSGKSWPYSPSVAWYAQVMAYVNRKSTHSFVKLQTNIMACLTFVAIPDCGI